MESNRRLTKCGGESLNSLRDAQVGQINFPLNFKSETQYIFISVRENQPTRGGRVPKFALGEGTVENLRNKNSLPRPLMKRTLE